MSAESAEIIAPGTPDVPEWLSSPGVRRALRVLYLVLSTLVSIVMFPLMLVVFICVALFLLVTLPHTLVMERRRRADLRVRLGLARLLSPTDLERHLAEGRGTLIVDEDAKRAGSRLWWTPNRILQHGPQPAFCFPPLDAEAWATREFIDWCRATYLDETRGTALAVDVSAGWANRLVHRLQACPTACEVVCLSDAVAQKSPPAGSSRTNPDTRE